jgi:predicted RNA-binding Zn-ribbon protein involved in translation (DUF1610 family)
MTQLFIGSLSTKSIYKCPDCGEVVLFDIERPK